MELPEGAVEAAAQELWLADPRVESRREVNYERRREAYISAARAALLTALPYIREQIVGEIQAQVPPGLNNDDADWADRLAHSCYADAVRIVRGATA